MGLTFGFYNSLNGDRKYNAEQLSSLFDGIISDGVFATVGDAFAVTANGENLAVQIGTGRAWFNRTWTNNDMPLEIVLYPADLIQDRIDSIVLEVDASDDVRANYIKVILGTPGASPVEPVLENTPTKHQYRMANIYVATGATTITQANITNKIGLSECPFITGLIDTIDISILVDQWENEFDEWFDNLEIQLSGDVAGNLQNQINNLPGKASGVEADSGSDDFKYLTPKSVKDSKNIPNVVPGSSGNVLISDGENWISSHQVPSNLAANGRLTLDSLFPVTINDITLDNNLYYAPFRGNRIHLWSNNKWNSIPFETVPSSIPAMAQAANTKYKGEISMGSPTISFPTGNTSDLSIGQYVVVTNYAFRGKIISKTSSFITLDKTYNGVSASNAIVTFPAYEDALYDVFAYLDQTVKLDYRIWNSDLVTRDSALALQDGVPVLASDPTRRYIGSVAAVSGGISLMDRGNYRNVWNYYNRVPRPLRLTNSSAHTYSVATWRLWNGSDASKVSFVIGIEEEPVFANGSASWSASAGTMISNFALGINSSTVPDDDYRFNGAVNTQRNVSLPNKPYYVGIGYKYIAMLETWISGTSVNWSNMSINGYVLG